MNIVLHECSVLSLWTAGAQRNDVHKRIITSVNTVNLSKHDRQHLHSIAVLEVKHFLLWFVSDVLAEALLQWLISYQGH